MIEALPDLEIVVTPVGGGGLLSGTCLGAHYFKPGLKVYAGEPEGAADAVLSIQTGKVEKAPFINTIADGLMTTLSERTLNIIKEHVTEILLVSDEEIKAALRLVYERMKIIIEPSCAVPLAAVLKNPVLFKGKKVGIILSGGNVDLSKFKDWF
jgi:threonine dehydratase